MSRSRQGHDSVDHGEASLDGEEHSHTMDVPEKAADRWPRKTVSHVAGPVCESCLRSLPRGRGTQKCVRHSRERGLYREQNPDGRCGARRGHDPDGPGSRRLYPLGGHVFLSHGSGAYDRGHFSNALVTHFCAPVFAFTAGMGAFLWVRRKTTAQLSRFLLTRGLWLIVLELTVLRFILYLNIAFHNTRIVLLVIWMLGASMVVVAALVHLPTRWLAAVSIAIITSHNLLDPVAAARFGPARWAWDILHQQAIFRVDGDSGVSIMVAYPLIPWVAVMAARYCFGPVLLWEPTRRQRFLVRLGIALSIAFVLLRTLNRYGDPVDWSVQRSTLFTMLSFPNCTKYPPSLAFLLMTMGPALAAMAWRGRARLSSPNPAIVFGRAPFFFYLVHLAVIHAVSIVLGFVRYGNASFLWMSAPSMGGPRQMFPPGYGYDLWVDSTVLWGVIEALYLVCRWYARLKQRRRDWWLSYL